MDSQTDRPLSQLGRARRLQLIVGGGFLIGLLLTAVSLTPDQRGYGTHSQLGFTGTCTIRQKFGIPCPSCGMTTAWSYLVRGRLLASAQANVGGGVLAILALVLGPWALASGIRGRWIVREPQAVVASWGLLALMTLILVEWVIRVQLSR